MDHFNKVTSHNLVEFVCASEFINVNRLRVRQNTSLDHALKVSELFTRLRYEGRDVLVDCKCLDSRNRPDILVLDVLPPIAYEVMSSEGDKSIFDKSLRYPFRIVTIKI